MFLSALADGRQLTNNSPGSSFLIEFDSQTNQIELTFNRVSQRADYVELFGPGDVPGYLTDRDMLAIGRLAKKLPNNSTIVEIGSFLGKSAVEWARAMEVEQKSCQVVCIDSFNAPIHILKDLLVNADFNVPEADTNFELFAYYTKSFDNITAIEAFFNQDFEFDYQVDLVFEDSDHTQKYLSYALPFWWSKVKPGGILSGHDYNSREVKAAVDTFSVLRKLKVKTFPDSSIWYIEK